MCLPLQAPPKAAAPTYGGGAAPTLSSHARATRDAALLWQLKCFADELLVGGYNQVGVWVSMP